MSRFIIVFLTLLMSLDANEVKTIPTSPDALEGKSVYVPPAPAVDVVEEGCVQKEDQNTTGYGRAQ
jgi:hypothetical protein